MTEFNVRCYKTDSNGDSIGAEVVIYDGDDVIDKITLVDQTRLDELTSKLDNLDSNYIDVRELKEILTNSLKNNTINATLLNGLASDKFLKIDQIPDYTFIPKLHTSATSEYGLGNNNVHGHVKTVNNLNSEIFRNGEALSAYQGKLLNDSITDLSQVSKYSLHSKFKLVKRNGVVQLTIEEWPGEDFVNGRTGKWIKIFDIPQGYRPTTLGGDVKNIYCPNLYGYHLRVRINVSSNEIQVYSDGSDNKEFFGTVTWITDE